MLSILLIYAAFIIIALFRREGPFVLYLYSSAILSIGYFAPVSVEMKDYLELYLICNLVVLFGMLVAATRVPREKSLGVGYLPNQRGYILTFWIVVFVIGVHYYVVGIPALSGNVDVSRFTVASSGFFGIPSRFATYMPSLLFIAHSIIRPYLRIGRTQSTLMLVAILAAILMQGHKSSLLQIVFLMILVTPFVKRGLPKFQVNNKKIAYGLVLSIGFALFSFYQMESLSTLSIYEYIVLRYTIIMHSPGLHLLELDSTTFTFWGGSAIVNDLLYPLLRLLGEDVITLNIQLSRNLYGVDGDDFTVPVTPGFFAYHAFLLGPYLVFLMALTYGLITGGLYSLALTASRPILRVVALFLIYWIWVGYGSGNPYYLFFNVILAIVCFTLIYAGLSTVLNRFKYGEILK